MSRSKRLPRSFCKSSIEGRRSGYSLLEVILATAILAASALLMASMIANGSRAILIAEQRTRGAAIVASLIDETIALQRFDETEYEGVTGVDFPWAYRIQVEPLPAYGMIKIIAEAVPTLEGQSDPWNDPRVSGRSVKLVRWTQANAVESDSFGRGSMTNAAPGRTVGGR